MSVQLRVTLFKNQNDVQEHVLNVSSSDRVVDIRNKIKLIAGDSWTCSAILQVTFIHYVHK
jgi:hypothetical protein